MVTRPPAPPPLHPHSITSKLVTRSSKMRNLKASDDLGTHKKKLKGIFGWY